MTDKIFVDKIPNAINWNETGYQITLFKEHGLNRGETVIANTCGGNFGRTLMKTIVECAMQSHMIDKENIIYSFEE